LKITHIRNATIVIHAGDSHILVDPMLAAKYALPPLRLLDGKRQRNPIVELPVQAEAAMESVTHCLITHCQKGHFDHLDRAGKRWLREKQIPVICTPHDAGFLRQRGMNVQPLPDDHRNPSPFLGGSISTVPCTHGEGLVGKFMEHGVGYLIELPGEPSLYLAGDTILTPGIRSFVTGRQPDVCVVPAGGARFDMGQDIIMGVEEVIAFARLLQPSQGLVIANHLEALSHCPVQREELASAASSAGVMSRLRIPQDGETVEVLRSRDL